MLKLNLGCAGRPIQGYVNIDLDDVDTMRRRYPNIEISDDIAIYLTYLTKMKRLMKLSRMRF